MSQNGCCLVMSGIDLYWSEMVDHLFIDFCENPFMIRPCEDRLLNEASFAKIEHLSENELILGDT